MMIGKQIADVFGTNIQRKHYEITILARKGRDSVFTIWLDDIHSYVARVQKMLRETDFVKDRYCGVKVSLVQPKKRIANIDRADGISSTLKTNQPEQEG